MAVAEEPSSESVSRARLQEERRRLKKKEKERLEKLFPEGMRLKLSTWHIIMTGIAVVLQVILYSIEDDEGIALLGMGIWSGLCFGVAGVVGCLGWSHESRRTVKGFMVMSFLAGIFAVALIGVCMSGIRQSYRNSQSGKVSNNYHRIHSKIRYALFWYFSGFSFLRTSLIRIRRSHRCHFYDCLCRPSSDLTSAHFWNLWSCWTSVVLWYMCILGTVCM